MFVSFKADGVMRGTQILKAESPMGPFLVHSDGPVTPRDWSCLDSTLYVEDGVPYMVFCHEWSQPGVDDGEMCVIPLTDDLKANRFRINLWEDQLIHILQIVATFIALA